MKNRIISDSYYVENQVSKNGERSYLDSYPLLDDVPVSSIRELMTQIGKDLPADINIFSELPKEVFGLPEVGEMLSELKKVLDSVVCEDITLSKLRISEQTEEGIVLDWIFNYFRVYFSFEYNGGDSIGMISNNPLENSFSTVCKEIKYDQYEEVATEAVEFVLDKLNA